MENGKIVLTSNEKGMKFYKQMNVFWVIVFVIGFIFSAKTLYNSYYVNYKGSISAYETEKESLERKKLEVLRKREELSVEYNKELSQAKNEANIALIKSDYNWQMERTYTEIRILDMELRDLDYKRPRLIADNYFVISLLGSLFFGFMVFLRWLCYFYEKAIAKDILELDPVTGKARITHNFPFDRDETTERVFDSITGLYIERGVYQKAMNVGSLTMSANYIVANEIHHKTWTLKYCDNPEDAVEKIQNFMREKGKSAVKVEIV